MNVADGYQAVCDAIANAWRVPPRVSIDDWADAHRVLPSKAAAEPGQWRTSRVPYLREIMRVLSAHHPAERVVFMKSSQVGGTEVGNNWVGCTIDTQPAPMLCVAPTVDMAELWSKQRIAPMIQDTKVLRDKISPARSRDSGNTTLLKDFPGGVLRFAGANSAASLASMPVKYLFLDEVDRFPQEVEDEGDPITLAVRRTSTFAKRKLFMVSTPTVKGASRIAVEFEQSDQRRYYVPCPDCGEKQHLKWANIRFDKNARPITLAQYACEYCGVLIDDFNKTSMLELGEWRAEFPERSIVGFHISALYTPTGLGDSWAELAEWFLNVKNDPTKLKGFINTALGEAWDNHADHLSAKDLKKRVENYAMRTVPKGCYLLTAGVDVQINRLAVQIVGWGRREAAWVIDWLEIAGDPAQLDVWNALDALLEKPIMNQFGVPLRVMRYAVDSGFLTHEVYNYCRARKYKGAFATKGHSQSGKAIMGRPSAQDMNWRGKTLKNGVDLYLIGADSAKSSIFARIDADDSLGESERLVHFSKDLPDEYFEQLTAETFDPERNKWLKLAGRRNEALDTFVGAYAAALHPSIRVHMIKDHEWSALESKIEPAMKDLFAQAPETALEVDELKPAAAQSAADGLSPHAKEAPFKRKNFATNWRT